MRRQIFEVRHDHRYVLMAWCLIKHRILLHDVVYLVKHRDCIIHFIFI